MPLTTFLILIFSSRTILGGIAELISMNADIILTAKFVRWTNVALLDWFCEFIWHNDRKEEIRNLQNNQYLRFEHADRYQGSCTCKSRVQPCMQNLQVRIGRVSGISRKRKALISLWNLKSHRVPCLPGWTTDTSHRSYYELSQKLQLA